MKDLKKDLKGKYNGNESNYVLEFLDSENDDNKKSPWTYRFESGFAKLMGVKCAIAHNSGTSTLHSCLDAIGVGFGDEVIMPAQTVSMVAFVTISQNAVPVFADSDPDTFNISPEDFEKKITNKTKAVIPVHMHGLPADLNPIMKIARKHNIVVIEDCAQSILAKYKGKTVGTIGDMASYSFETKKHLSTGEGGMVITNNEDYAVKIRKFGGLGYRTLTGGAGIKPLLPEEFQNPFFKRHDQIGLNYRMPEVVAAIGLAQLERIEFLVERRRKVAEFYLDALNDCDWIIPQKVEADCVHVYWTFTVRYEGMEKHGTSWREFYNAYKNNGGDGFYGGLGLVYQEPFMQEKPFLNHRLPKDHPLLQGKFNYENGLCPIAESTQPKLMQFKTNYRDLEEAKKQGQILKKTIKQIEGK